MAETQVAQPIVHTIELQGPKPELIIQESSSPNGKPMLQMVYIGGSYPTVLKFGVGKAKMILHALPEIKAFFDKHGHTLKS